tara:strand:+ start:50 stop:547 length:498 start_codon:yes stop_codon:yes gene_type:complete
MAPNNIKLIKAFKAQQRKLERYAKINNIPEQVHSLGCNGSRELDYSGVELEKYLKEEARLQRVCDKHKINQTVANMGTTWEPDENELAELLQLCPVCGELCDWSALEHCLKEKIESLAQEIIEKVSKNDISDTDITNATTFLQATWDTINAETVHPSVRILKKPN